jgi:uncharacterized protein
LKDLLLYLAKSLVTNPDAVKVIESEKDGRLTLILEVEEGDRGRVIGRSGKTANAIRTVINAAAGKGDRKIGVEIAE